LFLLPSAQVCFGVAAHVALAGGVRAGASRWGGLPEAIDDGVPGVRCAPDRLDLMAAQSVDLLTDSPRHAAMARAAADVVRSRYRPELVVPAYEALYDTVLSERP
jgi:glycosyltransferase involved in cell wall biosynthesis